MSTFVPSNVFLRGVLLHYFNLKKSADESHRILVAVFGDHALAERTCQKWFARFKSGNFNLEDDERPGAPLKFKDEELEARLDEDPSQTPEELAKLLGVTRAAICHRLKAMGMIQKPTTMSDDGAVTTKRGRRPAEKTEKAEKPEKAEKVEKAETKKRKAKDTKEDSNDVSPVKRGRGRPKGTTKKKVAAKPKPKGSAPGKKGRPKKEAPKDSEEEEDEEDEAAAEEEEDDE